MRKYLKKIAGILLLLSVLHYWYTGMDFPLSPLFFSFGEAAFHSPMDQNTTWNVLADRTKRNIALDSTEAVKSDIYLRLSRRVCFSSMEKHSQVSLPSSFLFLS
jgi:hypothetical protein